MKLIFAINFFLLLPSFLYGQLSGSYTIGGINPNYATITQAIDSTLAYGVSGPVVFNIRDGVYPEAISFNGNWIMGFSVTNTITFQSETQNPTAVTIYDTTGKSIDVSRSDGLIINNLTLNGTCEITYSPNTVFTNNIYYGCTNCFFDFRIAYSGFNVIENNLFYGNIDDSYSNNCKWKNNVFYGNVEKSYGSNDTIANNLIHGFLRKNFGNNSIIVHNNFGSDPTYFFSNGSYHSLVENNIMPAIFYTSGNDTIRNNNYPFGGGLNDSFPYFIDPQYISSTDLHSTNPQLIAKGFYYPKVPTDFDNQNRPDPPTIGANEICISTPTVNSYCGDSITLSLCNLPAGNNFLWTPSAGLNDIHLARPTVSVISSQWYFVTDSVLGYSDSVYINVIPFMVNAGLDDSILVCGKSVVIKANYNANASYQWSPIDSLSYPNSYFTKANPSQTTTYVITASVPGCSVSSDSVTVFVDPLPYCNAFLNSHNFNEFCFSNASTCANSYLWNFGDSTFSADVNPCHFFADTGLFLVTLIACNNFGCDTFQKYVYVDSVLISNIAVQSSIEEFKLYPNPAKNYFTIYLPQKFKNVRLEVFTILGEGVCQFPAVYNLEPNFFNLPSGIYMLKVFVDDKVFNKKLVVD